MCRVDPQAGEPGPCIVRARGGREHGKDAPPSSLLTTGAFRPLEREREFCCCFCFAVGTIVDDKIARDRNPDSELEGGIYLFGGCSTGLAKVGFPQKACFLVFHAHPDTAEPRASKSGAVG